MTVSFKVRRFSALQMLFAATVLLMIVKAVALRNHLVVNDAPLAFGAQALDQDEQNASDDDGDTAAHDGDLAATVAE